MKAKTYDVIIIGAGVSGLFFASVLSHKVNGIILDGSKSPGLKLLMSGGGQCNLTHSGSIKDFISCYFENGSKVRSCLYKYNNLSMMDFFESHGLPLVTRDDSKVFPKSMKARDVLELLLKQSKANGFDIVNEKVTRITPAGEDPMAHELNDQAFGGNNSAFSTLHSVQTANGLYKAKYVIIASGGCSYPSTGSDGSMFPLLREIPGMSVTPLVPALAPLFTKNYPYSELSGISFRDAHVSLYRDGKKASEQTGDLLLTDRNFSGPCILHLSRDAEPGDILSINYLGKTFDMSEKKKISKMISESKSKAANILASEYSLPKSFAQALEKRACQRASEIAKFVIADEFEIDYPGGFNKAMVTRGGISLKSIKTSTMEIKSVPGMYAIGEVLDVDGKTGGYNIQFAYSSACAAANDLADKL